MPSPRTLSRMVWLDLLIAFAALNGWAFASDGLVGFAGFLTGLGPFGVVAIVDLLLALAIGMVFVVRDARARGHDWRPYIVVTLLTGSIGLLAYLARHGLTAAEPTIVSPEVGRPA
ncbi:MAG TPA: hypothetical protein VJZ72_01490 [Candidatus Limnocylindrales bacterium]|nr:hypothetical protein [Candidatus Limnocylindrales bacterium]